MTVDDNKKEALITAEKYIDSLKAGILQAVSYYQSGEESKGSALVIQICDGIEWLVKALTLCYDIINLQRNINILNEKLNEIVDAFENEDYVLIADLLEYEIIPVLDGTKDNIKNIQI